MTARIEWLRDAARVDASWHTVLGVRSLTEGGCVGVGGMFADAEKRVGGGNVF